MDTRSADTGNADTGKWDSRSEVLRELFQLAPSLERFRAEGMARRGLTQPRARLLRTLDEGGPQVMSELSRALDVTPRAVTALVDGLEARRSRPALRAPARPPRHRGRAHGRRAGARAGEMRDGHLRLSEEILGGVSERDLTASLRVVRTVRNAMEARRA